jgi:cytochrome c biogenesis protein CcmG/thiol:disulfide interchange protein DsbE
MSGVESKGADSKTESATTDDRAPGTPWRRLVLTALIVGPILGLLAFGFTRDARYITSPLLAKQAAPFTVTLFDGSKLSLDDLRGKAVFLNFWASWCPPCRAEARDLEAAWRKVKDRNVVFLGVALQDTDQASREFLREFEVTYPNGRDESGKIGVDYGTWGIPESFFIDPDGRITYKHVGGISAELVLAKLDEAAQGIASAQEGRGDYSPVR